jgi:carboxyl-terminal processing protease
VGGINVVGKKTEDITNMLKGQAGTPIKLKVIRLGQTTPTEINLKREEIKVKAVSYIQYAKCRSRIHQVNQLYR